MQEELCRILADKNKHTQTNKQTNKQTLCLLTSGSCESHPDEEFTACCPGASLCSQPGEFYISKEQKGKLWLPWTYSHKLHVDKTCALWFHFQCID